jgi:hypothetical protein
MECRKEMLHCTDVIKVPVREDQRFDAPLSAAERRRVRDEVIDARHVLLRELEAEIDDIEIAVDIDDEAVTTHLFEASEGVDPESFTAALRDLLALMLRALRSVSAAPLGYGRTLGVGGRRGWRGRRLCVSRGQ